MLAYKPCYIYVKRYVRNVWALKSKAANIQVCSAEYNVLEPGVLVSPYPNLPFTKSNADASLLASLLIGKYMGHLPFYRMRESVWQMKER